MHFSTLCIVSLAAGSALAAPVQPHESGGKEHIVIISNEQDLPTYVEEVLERLALNTSHPDVRQIYNNSAFRGFSANMKSHCLDLLANMSDINVVEEAVSVEGLVMKASLPERSDPAMQQRDGQYYATRSNAPWGLQSISTTSPVEGSTSAMDYTYSYANQDLGAGVDVYVLDTGIYTDHTIFGGRAKMIWSYDSQFTDLDGHGTHVSGTAAGAILGVASNANIFGVRALDANGGGWSSDVVAGIDFVIQQHDKRKSEAASNNFKGSVLSMSLASAGQVTAITQAVQAAVGAGVHACVAAGNSDVDACSASPASAGGSAGPAITVGAVDMNAKRASFSNYGSCVDVYAPGVDIISAWIGGTNMINQLSGTSMATPHVTGIVAYAMANATLAGNPALMKEWISMSALDIGDGILLANNGVKGGNSEGLLGFSKKAIEGNSGFVSTTSVPASTDGQTVAQSTPLKMARRPYSSGVYRSGLCRRNGVSRGSKDVWLCRAAKRGLTGLDNLVSDAEKLRHSIVDS
ncbi:subtilisin-like protein [Polychaeton citri CBS 116435]|uniref:Subtilisin-like protein n=1 Tax=Polychaeton citri CBS 116435 TaxID=1314669 RepID=A0A9P4USI1_9PEZI|nr:subtilisin-like protein [Polychaeton citri CBS 116435]